MSQWNWNWKHECCLIFCGLLAGGPLGSIFVKTLQGLFQPYPSSHKSGNNAPRFLANAISEGDLSSSTLSLLVPSSLWFVLTTSCVGCFFWGLGEILRKLHSITTTTSTPPAPRRGRSRDAGAGGGAAAGIVPVLDGNGRVQFVRGGVGGAVVGRHEGQIVRGGIVRARLEGGIRDLGGLIQLDHNYQIHHLARRVLIFPYLPHGRLRLWGF